MGSTVLCSALCRTVAIPIERIAFAIVPDEVRYPDRIVGITLLLWSMQ
jgi:hypothetical protein